jgi:glycosyltransferase involved in cell wall biosynthesis
MKVRIIPAYIGWIGLTPDMKGADLYHQSLKARGASVFNRNSLAIKVLKRGLQIYPKARHFKFRNYLNNQSENIWILDRIIKELIDRLEYVYCYDEIDEADINYYVNWHAFKGSTSGLDVAFFTHYEPRSKQTFFDVARSMDHCIFMSEKYRLEMRELNIDTTSTIPLGVDLALFKPKLILGCVGSFSQNEVRRERKGYDMIQALRGLDWIDVRITEGELNFSELPDFYRELDYVLIPSSIEGGPMCVSESLACGIPVIAPPDVGAISEYDTGIINYTNGDFESLKAVLVELYEKKLHLRQSVEHLTWDNFATRHDELFRWLTRNH